MARADGRLQGSRIVIQATACIRGHMPPVVGRIWTVGEEWGMEISNSNYQGCCNLAGVGSGYGNWSGNGGRASWTYHSSDGCWRHFCTVIVLLMNLCITEPRHSQAGATAQVSGRPWQVLAGTRSSCTTHNLLAPSPSPCVWAAHFSRGIGFLHLSPILTGLSAVEFTSIVPTNTQQVHPVPTGSTGPVALAMALPGSKTS